MCHLISQVTGDYGKTAEAIARDVGIITAPIGPLHSIQHLNRVPPEELGTGATSHLQEQAVQQSTTIIIGGPQLPFLNDYQWDQLCTHDEIVFARTTPQQKLRIVREFQSRGHIVAMTGDGVNDAPSLKGADIGLTMSSGSDVAMEAADIVFLDSFAAIITAIRFGRLTFDNLKKTVIYQLPAGVFAELWPVLLNIFFGLPQILSRFLMIVISILTDTSAAITLAFEMPEMDLLARPPRNERKDRLTNPRLLIHGFIYIGILECLTSMAMAFWYLQRHGVPFGVLVFSFGEYPDSYDPDTINEQINVASSIYFVNLVVTQMFNLFAARTRVLSNLQQVPIIRKSTRNYWLFLAIAFAWAVSMVSCSSLSNDQCSFSFIFRGFMFQ
jgi:sodium/potassium-transporting ATPase subunit alpha